MSVLPWQAIGSSRPSVRERVPKEGTYACYSNEGYTYILVTLVPCSSSHAYFHNDSSYRDGCNKFMAQAQQIHSHVIHATHGFTGSSSEEASNVLKVHGNTDR